MMELIFTFDAALPDAEAVEQESWTTGCAVLADLEWRIVTPIRGEDYPILAEIWENDEDDGGFF